MSAKRTAIRAKSGSSKKRGRSVSIQSDKTQGGDKTPGEPVFFIGGSKVPNDWEDKPFRVYLTLPSSFLELESFALTTIGQVSDKVAYKAMLQVPSELGYFWSSVIPNISIYSNVLQFNL